MTRTPDAEGAIDWGLTTWEGSRREQLRRWAALPLDRVIAALEEMEALARALGSADLSARSPGAAGLAPDGKNTDEAA